MGRPTKAEKYSPQAQKEMLRELCGNAIYLMNEHLKDLIEEQKRLKKDKANKQIMKVDIQSLGTLVGKMLPIVVDENTETQSDVTMDLLIKKAINVNMRIQEANEEGLKEEEAEPESPTS